MITCTIRYGIDSATRGAFETYTRFWVQKIADIGGKHYSYYLPSNDTACAHLLSRCLRLIRNITPTWSPNRTARTYEHAHRPMRTPVRPVLHPPGAHGSHGTGF